MIEGERRDGGVAVVGSGAIGCYLAGEFQRAGRDVTLCVRTPVERITIVEPEGERDVAIRVATRPDQVGPVRWLLITTKAQDVPGASNWLAGLVGPDTITVVVQNGVDHAARVRPFLPDAATILPAIIYCSVERTVPGRVVHHGGSRLVVPEGAVGEAFAALLAGTVFTVERASDFGTVAWRKLLSNAIVNPITALTLRRATVFGNDRVRALASDMLAEAVAVARADGAAITDDEQAEILAGYGRMASGGSSMLYDRLAERPLEYDFISGAIVAAGERHGVPVPLNRAILALAAAASGRKLDGSE